MTTWAEKGAGEVLDDISAMLDAMHASDEHQPDLLYMSERTWLRIVRATMRKRQWRRWRGKYKEANRCA